MLDKQHSYCAKKISLQSLPPTTKGIVLILEIHNQERSNVNGKHMQKIVIENASFCMKNENLASIPQHYGRIF